MPTAKKLIEKIENFAPLTLQENYDNSGLMLGDINQEINGVFVCLDVDMAGVDSAIKQHCNFIISHHPLIFNPLKNLDFSLSKSKLIEKLIKNNIVVYSTHTCFDNAKDSIAYINLCKLDLKYIEKNVEYYTAKTNPILVKDLANKVATVFKDKNTNYTLGDKVVTKVCHVNGSGGRMDELLPIMKKENINVFISSEFKYSFVKDLKENNIAVIELCHYNSELAFLSIVKDLINGDNVKIVLNTITECPFERSIK